MFGWAGPENAHTLAQRGASEPKAGIGLGWRRWGSGPAARGAERPMEVPQLGRKPSITLPGAVPSARLFSQEVQTL